jgi:hypothetical protein
MVDQTVRTWNFEREGFCMHLGSLVRGLCISSSYAGILARITRIQQLRDYAGIPRRHTILLQSWWIMKSGD